MAIAITLQEYLRNQSADYETVTHPYTATSMDTAAVAHVSGDRLAKAVIVKDSDKYVMVVLPADYHVHLGKLTRHLGHKVGLATEKELASLFPDCENGAIPPMGIAYHMETVVDDSVSEQGDIFFESGDHRHLIRMSGSQYATLLADAEHASVSTHL